MDRGGLSFSSFKFFKMSKFIKFSYPFKKLLNCNNNLIQTALLLQVLQVDLSDISQEMRDYDTDFGAYPLPPKGAFLMLIFMKTNGGGLFTTLRRETPQKLEYYQSQQGNWFELQISHDLKKIDQ